MSILLSATAALAGSLGAPGEGTADAPPPAPVAEVAAPVTGRPPERRMSLTAEGGVLDAKGQPMTTLTFAERIGDDETIRRYRVRRGFTVGLSSTAIAVGGTVFLGGVIFELGGGLLAIAHGGDPTGEPVFLHGALVTGAGGALAAGGIYGLVSGLRRVDEPRHFYYPDTLRSVIDTWNAGDDPGELVGLRSVEVRVGLGAVIVVGTF